MVRIVYSQLCKFTMPYLCGFPKISAYSLAEFFINLLLQSCCRALFTLQKNKKKHPRSRRGCVLLFRAVVFFLQLRNRFVALDCCVLCDLVKHVLHERLYAFFRKYDSERQRDDGIEFINYP